MAVEGGEQPSEIECSEYLGYAEAQLSAQHCGEHGPGAREQQRADMGESDAAGGALEQGGAELAFQVADLGGDCGLRDVQLLGCAGEPAEPGDGFEVHELT